MSALASALSSIGLDGPVLSGPQAGAWAVHGVTPSVVVFPRSTEAVAQLLTRANQEGWRVVAAGKGGWSRGGNPPERIDVVLSLEEMAGVFEYEPGDLTLTAGAGMPLHALQQRLGEEGQWFPLDPPGWAGGTLGGVVATGSAGPLQLGYGGVRDLVLGLELVTGDGRVLRLGGKVVKNVAGFDLVRPAVGSWGTLGVITRLSIRVFPVSAVDRTLLLPGVGRKGLGLGRGLATAPVSPAALEWTRSESGSAWVAARLLGSAREVDAVTERIEALAGAAPELLEGESSVEWWDRLSRLEDGALASVRLARLPSALPDLVADVERGVGEGGLPEPAMAAHLGRGVLRLAFPDGPDSTEALGRWLASARTRLEANGGTLTVSSGPPELLARVPAWGDPGPAGALAAGLRDRFDPRGILAPERFAS